MQFVVIPQLSLFASHESWMFLLQIDSQPTLAVGTQQGRVAREALAEITRSQLPPQLPPQLPAAAAARIQSWVQDAAQNDAASDSGGSSGGSLAQCLANSFAALMLSMLEPFCQLGVIMRCSAPDRAGGRVGMYDKQAALKSVVGSCP